MKSNFHKNEKYCDSLTTSQKSFRLRYMTLSHWKKIIANLCVPKPPYFAF